MLRGRPARDRAEDAEKLRVAAEAGFESRLERVEAGMLCFQPHEALYALVIGVVPERHSELLVE